MSGARLETLGQVRNVYPYATNTGITVAIAVPVATFAGEAALRIDRSEIPFDRGPDKSARTFMVLSNLTAIISVNAGTTTQLNGFIYYRGNDGRRMQLAAIAATIAAPTALNSLVRLTPALPITAESVDNIGYLGFTDSGSTAGTATTVTITANINVGMYGDYAEVDFTELLGLRNHEHLGMDIVTYLDDTAPHINNDR